MSERLAATAAALKRVVPQRWRSAVRELRDQRHRRSIPGKARLGGKESWHVYLPYLNSSSIVYCAGAGRDVSFEKELVALVGCHVHLFDPSPTGIETMEAPENRSDRITFHPIGLAGTSGDLVLDPPRDPEEGSYPSGGAGKEGSVVVRCDDLATIMGRLGHTHLDLLKMDIEGAEYGVIQQIAERRIPIGQICVELHPYLSGANRAKTREALRTLRDLGYVTIHRKWHDYTLVRPGAWRTPGNSLG